MALIRRLEAAWHRKARGPLVGSGSASLSRPWNKAREAIHGPGGAAVVTRTALRRPNGRGRGTAAAGPECQPCMAAAPLAAAASWSRADTSSWSGTEPARFGFRVKVPTIGGLNQAGY